MASKLAAFIYVAMVVPILYGKLVIMIIQIILKNESCQPYGWFLKTRQTLNLGREFCHERQKVATHHKALYLFTKSTTRADNLHISGLSYK